MRPQTTDRTISMTTSKRILLTGAGRGLGLAMAEGFIELGNTVIACSKSPSGVEALSKRFGSPNRFDVVDVAKEPQVRDWAAMVLKEAGPPDLLLNNAAIVNRN